MRKDGSMRVIAKMWKVKKCILQKLYQLPKIQNFLQKLEGFKYATLLDLNMNYYHIDLSLFAKCIYPMVLSWDK